MSQRIFDSAAHKEFMIRELKEEIKALNYQNVRLKLEVDRLKSENAKLKR
jgi:hypothetical protein